MYTLLIILSYVTPQGITLTSQTIEFESLALCEGAEAIIATKYDQNRKTFGNMTYIRADSHCVRTTERKY